MVTKSYITVLLKSNTLSFITYFAQTTKSCDLHHILFKLVKKQIRSLCFKEENGPKYLRSLPFISCFECHVLKQMFKLQVLHL